MIRYSFTYFIIYIMFIRFIILFSFHRVFIFFFRWKVLYLLFFFDINWILSNFSRINIFKQWIIFLTFNFQRFKNNLVSLSSPLFLTVNLTSDSLMKLAIQILLEKGIFLKISILQNVASLKFFIVIVRSFAVNNST